MKKKIYSKPQIEVHCINHHIALLSGSPIYDLRNPIEVNDDTVIEAD